MGEKDNGLSLGLSLGLGCGENANNNNNNNNNNNQPPLFMHKPPQSVPNQRASFNNLFHFHGMSFFLKSLSLSLLLFNFQSFMLKNHICIFINFLLKLKSHFPFLLSCNEQHKPFPFFNYLLFYAKNTVSAFSL